MKVLIADDYDVIRQIHIECLKDLGIVDVDQVINGDQAVHATRRAKYDLILMDMYMPVMTGLEAVKIIRQTDTRTPIVMITDDKDRRTIQALMGAGVTDYLLKPYRPESFEEVIKKAIQDKLP